MTIKALYPTVRPTLNLDFAKTKALDSRITFTRLMTGASVATYVGADGLIKTAGNNVPRFDHNPATGESLGLLVEEPRTNALTYSQAFSTAPWTLTGGTLTANSTIAPDGTTTAFTLKEDSTTGSHHVNYIITQALNNTFSIYAKLASGTRTLYINNGGRQSAFTLSGSGSVVLEGGSGTTGSASITPLTNGWYRCSVVLSGGAVQTNQVIVGLSQAIAGSTYGNLYAGDNTSSIYIWGAQLEAGSFPTSYIPTSGSTVTRGADVASMTGTNFSSWYRQDEGTFLMEEASSQSPAANTHRLEIYRNGAANTDAVVFVSGYSTEGTRLVGRAGGSNTSLDLNVNNTWTNTAGKSAFAIKTNDCSIVRGSSSGTDAASTFPQNLDALGFGAPSNTFQSNSVGMNTIARITYWPVRLPNAQLQTLTAT